MKDKMEVFKSKERKTDLKIGTYFDFFSLSKPTDAYT